MSDGIKYVYSAIRTGEQSAFFEIPEPYFIGKEIPLFRFVRQYLQRYNRLPAEETTHEETGVAPLRTPEPTEFYAGRVIQRYAYNATKPHLSVAMSAMQQMDIAQMKEAVMQMQRSLNSTIDRSGGCSSTAYVENVFESSDYMRTSPDEIAGVTTGYPALDEATGGYLNGTRATWVSRPKVGKTTTLCMQNLAAARAGKKVLVVTMEMSGEQYTRRLVGILAGINPNLIRTGRISTRARNRVYEQAMRFLREHTIDILAGSFNRQISSIEEKIRADGYDVVYIDNAYHLHPSGTYKKGLSRTERAPVIEDELNELALKVNRPIVTTVQFARPATGVKDGKRGNIDTIGLTDAVAQNNSIVIGIHNGPRPRTKILEVLAAREGGMDCGDVVIDYDYDRMAFGQIEVIDRDSEVPEEE